MSENINNNVIASGIKFVDFAGLDHFWSIAKAYINAEDAKLQGAIDAVAGVVGDDKSGLVKDVKTLQIEVAALGGVAEGGIQGMIDKSLKPYSTTEQMNSAIATATTDMATKTELSALENGKVKANADAIAVLNGDGEGSVAKAIATATTDMATNAGVDAKLASYSTTEQMNSAIATATTDMATNAGVDTKLASYSTTEQMNSAIATATTDMATKTELSALENGKVKDNADAIAVLNGDGEGSVAKAITDAFNDFSTKVSDDKVVNTYKELIDYAAEHGSEFTELVGVVGEKASKTELSTAVSTLEGKISTADQNAKAYTDELANGAVKANTDAIAIINGTAETEGSIAKAKADAAADATSKANTAEANAKSYTDELANGAVKANTDAIAIINGTAETEGSIAKAKADAAADATSKANAAETNAKSYADGLVKDAEGNSLFDEAGSATTAESNANAYTDALANSIVIASLSDIDSIFGVTDHNHEA